MDDLSPTIGSVYGIDIQVHWLLLLFLFFLLFISYQLFALFTLFYACVLLHEVAHSVTSIRNGVPVKRIEINLLLGESFIDTENMKPIQEFYVSAAGPVSSILIGFVFGLLAIYAPPGFLRLLAQEMFILNIIVGVFNLLPGFPLDGGRVFRSYLQRRMDKLRATRITVGLGNVIAVLLVVGTVAYVLSSGQSFLYDEFVVLFDAIIAMFMYSGGQAELQSIYIKKYTSKISVRMAMSRDFILEKPTTTLSELYKDMISRHTYMALFFEKGSVKLVSKVPSNPLSKEGLVDSDRPISVWGADIPTVQYNASLDKAIEAMRFNDASIAAVVNGRAVVGVLLERHVESIVALHISHQVTNKKRQEKE
jgi:Zn-dependent protease